MRQEKDFFLVYDGTYPFFPYALILCVAPPWFEGEKKFCPATGINLIWFPFSAAPAFVGSRGEEARKKRGKRGRGYDDDGSKKGEETETCKRCQIFQQKCLANYGGQNHLVVRGRKIKSKTLVFPSVSSFEKSVKVTVVLFPHSHSAG